MLPVVDEVGVDLIGADEQIMRQTNLSKLLKLIACEGPSDRVVLVALDVGRRVRS